MSIQWRRLTSLELLLAGGDMDNGNLVVTLSISHTTRSSTISQCALTEKTPASTFHEVMTPWDQSEQCLILKYGSDPNDKLDNDSTITSGNVFDEIQDVIQEGNIGAIEHHNTGSYCADNLNDEISDDEEGDADYVNGDEESIISDLDDGKGFTGNVANNKTKLKGNRLLKSLELDELISENFLCKLCCKESVNQKKGFGRTLSEDAMLKATTHNHAFTCTLIATCASGKHTFKIEPDRGVMKASTANGSGEEQPLRCHGCPKSTMKIQNYCINFYAHLMIQMLGLGQMALDTILGMLGIVSHAGLTTCWAAILWNSIGISEQKWGRSSPEQ